MSRVLFSCFGSAGDLFPLVPIARRLERDGHDVLFAVPPSLGLYLRSVRLPAFAVGDGSELAFAVDDRLVTTRFGGWSSFRRIFSRYLAPTLAADLERVESCIARWQPDVIVTTSYATAGRLAAGRAGIPHVSCTGDQAGVSNAVVGDRWFRHASESASDVATREVAS
jgi:UDP:flavonoid glycosyltransferase YjiC (YdhE family)